MIFGLRASCLGTLLALLSSFPNPTLGQSIAAVPFLDVTEVAGIAFRHQNSPTPEKYLIETMGGGSAFIDFNNDGRLDIFLVNGGPTPGANPKRSYDHALYSNQGDGTFKLTTAEARIEPNRSYGMGLAVGDYQNDGYDDLFITHFNGPNVLYKNNGDGTFINVTASAAVGGDSRWSTSAAFVDYDQDGFLDLYVVRYVDHSFENNLVCGPLDRGIRAYCTPHAYSGVPDLLYRNSGDGTFSDVSRQAGVALSAGKGLGVALLDYNRDGYPDIYVANDSVPNFLFRNNRDGSFTEQGLLSGTGWNGQGQPQAGMGTSVGDYDEDGHLDIAVTNLDMEYLALYRNLGDGSFEDVSGEVGLQLASRPFVGFGLGFLDFDNDSDLDLFAVNGNVLDNAELIREGATYRQRKLLLENIDGRFKDVTRGSALMEPQVSRGLAFGDYDNDGDLDAILTNCGGAAVLLRNEQGNRNSWLQCQTDRKQVQSKWNRSPSRCELRGSRCSSRGDDFRKLSFRQ